VEQGIDHKKQLSSIINVPDSLRHSDIPLLRELVELYPYFQPLRLMLAKLSLETEEAEQTLTTTALYTNGAMLHQFLHRKSVMQPATSSESQQQSELQQQSASAEEETFEDKSLFEEATDLEAASLLEEVYAFGGGDPEQPEEINSVEEVNDALTDDQATYEEIAEINIHDYDNPIDHLSAENNDDTYEEISEINIHDYDRVVASEEPSAFTAPIAHIGAENISAFVETVEDIDGANVDEVDESLVNNGSTSAEGNDALEIFEEISEVDGHDYESPAVESPVAGSAPVIETLEDNFVEHIAATDFFTFEEKFIADDTENGSQALSAPAPAVWNKQQNPLEKDTSEITNYDDDSLPYTFLWWLAKTRKEHSTIFQPYATPKRQTQSELHQQYVEHIFHIQSPFNAEEILNNAPTQQADPKDAKIIDDFIKKDPQITPPKPEQIDTENKAKRSAEDHNDLVSETLAKIYIEQMLYHKAIDTYEKLSLKFPEKSRYFADLIQSIKKKI
jgi:hypothetical protein